MDDTINVKRITIAGEKYLIDGDDNLYDPEDQEHIGEYDRDNDEITFFEEEPTKTIKVFDKKKQVFNKVDVKWITLGGEDYLIDEDNLLYEDNFLYNPKYEPRYKTPIGLYAMGEIIFFRKEEELPTFVVKVPYPPNIRFNEKEQAYYNKNKKEVDENVKDELASNKLYREERYRSSITIYNKPIMGDVVYKRVAQIEWDTGISKDRPYTYNEGFVMEKIKKIKEKYANETDENKKATLKRTLVGLMPKLQQAKDVDKVEAVTIPREMKGMAEEESQTKQYLREKGWADEREERRLKAGKEASGKVVVGKGIDNPELYEKAKELVYKQYPKHSAYRSGQLVKKYKEMGGTYSGKKPKGGLTSWFKEDWKSIGGDYPTYRPTKRVNKDTPLTASEIDPKQAKKQIALKQEIKGDANLPPFQKEGEGLASYTNPKIAKKNAVKYLGKNVVLKPSTKKDKKFMVLNPDTNKFIHFGQLGFEDFTKHQDTKRQTSYLNRTANMRGDWKDDKYSANNLAREILWR